MSALLLGIFAALSWGVLDFAGRFASRGISAGTTVLWLTIFGFAGISAILAWNGGWPEIKPGSLWLIVLMGVGLALATYWLFEALARGPISVVSPIAASYPVTALIIAVWLGTRPTWLHWAAMAAVIVGVVLVAVFGREADDGSDAEPAPFSEILLYAGLAHLAFAVAITAGQHAAPIYGEVQATWLGRTFGIATMLVIVWWLRAGTDGATIALPVSWIPLLAVMGCLDVASLVAISAAGHFPNAEIATVLGSCFGVVTVLLGWLVLRERIAAGQWFGIALVFGGAAVLAT